MKTAKEKGCTKRNYDFFCLVQLTKSVFSTVCNVEKAIFVFMLFVDGGHECSFKKKKKKKR